MCTPQDETRLAWNMNGSCRSGWKTRTTVVISCPYRDTCNPENALIDCCLEQVLFLHTRFKHADVSNLSTGTSTWTRTTLRTTTTVRSCTSGMLIVCVDDDLETTQNVSYLFSLVSCVLCLATRCYHLRFFMLVAFFIFFLQRGPG